MHPLKSAQFAEVRIVGEKIDHDRFGGTGGINVSDGGSPGEVDTHTVGIAINLRINENLGSTQKNVIGTPVPIFIPGYYQATITAEKATLDLESWKTIANINPYTAYVPNTYDQGQMGLDYSNEEGFGELGALQGSDKKVPRFLFGLYVYDRIQAKASRPTGTFLCMLQSFNSALSANDAVILEDVTFLARPVEGSWFSVLSETFNLNTYFGYNSGISPQRGDEALGNLGQLAPGANDDAIA